MINWKQKLSSRKFWAAVIGFVTAMLVLFGAGELTVERTAGLLTALGTLMAYIFAEAYVDGRRAAETAAGEEKKAGPGDADPPTGKV